MPIGCIVLRPGNLESPPRRAGLPYADVRCGECVGMDKQPMLILHGIWMDLYDGFEKEIGAGGFDFAKEHGFGHELFNFRISHDRCYGFVQAGKNGTINIDKLGASRRGSWIDGVLVVWTAPHPDGDGRFVVGWYKNARVHREQQQPPRRSRRSYKGKRVHYNVEADANDCVLLTPDRRVLEIPHNKKGTPGQSSAFFPATSKYPEITVPLEKRIRNFVGSQGRRSKPLRNRPGGWGKADPKHRKKVEEAAIDAVTGHYENLGYTVESVESQNLGWDLQAEKGDKFICIEVKGLSASEPMVEVTPNEYDKIQDVENKRFKNGGYRLAIVTNALTDDPALWIFSYLKDRKMWIDPKTGDLLEILQKIAARITVSSP